MTMIKVASFISPHGFGHATRMAAVLQSITGISNIKPVIVSTVPEFIFSQSSLDVEYITLQTDVGFIQNNAFHIDIGKSCTALSSFYPLKSGTVQDIAGRITDCSIILCDISPMGIAAGKAAGIKSVLIENFTWDWLYEPFARENPEIQPYIDYLKQLYSEADIHIQTEPVCYVKDCDLRCGPIYRHGGKNTKVINNTIDNSDRKKVLITLGGIPTETVFFEKLRNYSEYFFIISGQQKEERIGNNILLLDRMNTPYHPDLINFADLVVFKSGYSTLAECFQSGTSCIYVRRDNFKESQVLESFARKNLNSVSISEHEFSTGDWLDFIEDIDATKRTTAHNQNGADEIAQFLLPFLN